jgi:L-aminopeptidase/D-esterase-like protein
MIEGETSLDVKFATNTTIGVVATNAGLNREQANKLATVAHDGIALAVRPAHTTHDGDTMFALGTGTSDHDAALDRLCAATVVSVARAIVSGVRRATGLAGVPAASDLKSRAGSEASE